MPIVIPYLIIEGLVLAPVYLPILVKGISHGLKILRMSNAFRVVISKIVMDQRIIMMTHRGIEYSLKLLKNGQVSLMGPQGGSQIPNAVIQASKEVILKGREFSGFYHPASEAAKHAGTVAGQVFFKAPKGW